MNKLLVSTILVSTLSLMTGCAMTSKTMTQEQADEVLGKNQTYLTDHSFAYNLCRYTVNKKGEVACPEDVRIPKAEFEKTFGANNKGSVDGSYAASLGVYALSSVIQPGFFDSFSEFGPGALFLIGGLLTGHKGSEADNRFVAFVPVSKAKTEEEAATYIQRAFLKSYRGILKKQGLKEVKNNQPMLKKQLDKGVLYITSVPFTTNDGCNEFTSKDGRVTSSCSFTMFYTRLYSYQAQTIIPAWLPNAGQKAWVVSGEAGFFHGKDYSGKLNQRDLVIEEAKGLPDNFYLLIPQSDSGEKKLPPFVVSNKAVYFYAVPKN